MDDLVAKLGAACLCTELGIAVEPRADLAQYLARVAQTPEGRQ
ncbi:hypothetical protein [Bradyrhizobium sp. LA7.1]